MLPGHNVTFGRTRGREEREEKEAVREAFLSGTEGVNWSLEGGQICDR